LRTTADGFLEWVESTERRFQDFDQLAAGLERYALDFRIEQSQGSHQRRRQEFYGTDFDQLRIEEREATVRTLQEDDPWVTTSDLCAWQDEWRFNFGIFSYFLTNERIVSETAKPLRIHAGRWRRCHSRCRGGQVSKGL
jgi:hypothetical protein